MIRKFRVRNYKSILDHEIELGRVNVFIGENGSGKTNILESVAFLAASNGERVELESLVNRGVRVARPAMTLSSFRGSRQLKAIEYYIEESSASGHRSPLMVSRLVPDDAHRAETAWTVSEEYEQTQAKAPDMLPDSMPPKNGRVNTQMRAAARRAVLHGDWLSDFVIYNPTFLALRGIHTNSWRVPLGIYGENLDLAIADLDDPTRADLLERARRISWLDRFELDPTDELKFQGHKLGRGTSRLYFRDRFMRQKNNLFSAENANEGILHILFYLTLFSHPRTPRVFGIDNIETALNPQLCRELMVQLADLAKRHDKQALITTHNPAILDGLNLQDDEQRLFVVSRDDDGHTVTERIRLKPEAPEGKYKLSELWMRGYLGGLPRRF